MWKRDIVPFCLPPSSFVSQSSSSGNPSLHGSMSSSADFSDDDDYSIKSGSASPAPGDTLPWNLPRHERYKRKSHGGSVLDPAERAVLRIAGEQQHPCLVSVRIWCIWLGSAIILLWCDGILVSSDSSLLDVRCMFNRPIISLNHILTLAHWISI